MSEVEVPGSDTPAPLMGYDLIRERGFWRVIKEDYQSHWRDASLPGLHALMVYRFGTWADHLKFRPFAVVMKALYYIAFWFVRNIYGIEMAKSAKVGRRFVFGHQCGIIVHKWAQIGDDVIIRQNVTFGVGTHWTHEVGPKIGSRVSISPGVVVIGNVNIGDDVSIGPNCVVTNDVPSGRTLFVAPPRVLPKVDTIKDSVNDQPA